MFLYCCKLKKSFYKKKNFWNDMLLMDEEKDLILQKQDEHNEFDLKLDLSDRKNIEKNK